MAECKIFPVINLAGTGRSIERCRKAAGLSVRDVQAYFGFEYPQAIYKWQHGECLPSVDNLLALARLLRVKMEDLLVYDDLEVPFFFGNSDDTQISRIDPSAPLVLSVYAYRNRITHPLCPLRRMP